MSWTWLNAGSGLSWSSVSADREDAIPPGPHPRWRYHRRLKVRITFLILGALLQKSSLAHLDRQCATRFDFIKFDEGHTPPDFREWEPPRRS
jgi:hypothetical protein